MNKYQLYFFSLSLLTLFALPLKAQSEAAPEPQTPAASSTGLPLPRFASMQSDQANMRTGPGTRYPIEWVYIRTGLPVEITAEYDTWRRIRDWEGSEGWVHKAALTGKRTAVVLSSSTILDKDKNGTASLATVQAGAIGHLLSCSVDWCKVRFKNIKGYMPKKDLWGAYAQEVFD